MVVPPVPPLTERLMLPSPEITPLKVWLVPLVLNKSSLVWPVAPLSMTMGPVKLKPAPEKRGSKTSVAASAPSFRRVSWKPPELIALLVKLRLTVVAALVVVTSELAVRVRGLPTGAVVTLRLALVLSLPPAKVSVPEPRVELPFNWRVAVGLTVVALEPALEPGQVIWPALTVVSPLYLLAPEIVSIPAEFNVSPPLVMTPEIVSAELANVMVLTAPARLTLPAIVTAAVPPAAWPRLRLPLRVQA